MAVTTAHFAAFDASRSSSPQNADAQATDAHSSRRAAAANAPSPEADSPNIRPAHHPPASTQRVACPSGGSSNLPQNPRTADLHEARDHLHDTLTERLAKDTSLSAIRGPRWFLEWMVEAAAGDPTSMPVNTRRQLAHQWSAWSKFCHEAGINQWRPDMAACTCADDVDRERIIWTSALIWIYGRMRPRKGNTLKSGPMAGLPCPPKPQSALAILRGVRKEHMERGITPPPLTLATRRCKELIRSYAEAIGPENLTPQRKQPLTRGLITAMLAIEDGAPIMEGGRAWTWRTAYGVSTKACIHTLAQCGFRKDEVALGPGNRFGTMRMSFDNLTWIFDGVTTASPSRAQLAAAKEGDYAVFRPPPSKADQWGMRWGNSPIYLPFASTKINAARALAAWELIAQVPQHRRRQTPLFCGPTGVGSSLTHEQLERPFRRMLRWVTGSDEEVRKYSIHSFRCYLASALMAAGRSDAEIQMALRWSSDEALKIYKVTNVEHYAQWLIEAERQEVTGMRARALPRALPQHDHIDRAIAVLDSRAELQARAATADLELASGTQLGPEDGAPDYDTTAVW